MNHQGQIGSTTGTTAVLGPKHLVATNGTMIFFNTGCHILRLHLSVRPWVAKAIDVRNEAPEPVVPTFRSELLSYLKMWDLAEVEANRTFGTLKKQGHLRTEETRRIKALRRLLLHVHDGLYLGSEKLIVVTDKPITVEFVNELIDIIAEAFECIMYSTKAPLPSLTKWTKQGPVGDRLIIAYLADNLLHIGRLAFKDVSYKERIHSAFGDMDTIHEWTRKTGKRYKLYTRRVEDVDKQIVDVIHAFVHEAFRFISLWIMKCAHGAKDFNKRPAIVCLADPRASPLRAALVYLSTLLNGTSSRLSLLLGFRNCKDMDQLWNSYPQDCSLLMRLAKAAIGAITRRMVFVFETWPFLLYAAPWREASDLRSQVILFINYPRHQLRAGCARVLHERVHAIEGSEARIRFMMDTVVDFKQAGHFVEISVAHVENLHAVHKRRAQGAGGQTPGLSSISAQSVVIQATGSRGAALPRSSIKDPFPLSFSSVLSQGYQPHVKSPSIFPPW